MADAQRADRLRRRRRLARRVRGLGAARRHPMLDMSFFRNRRFTAASLGVMLGYFAMFGALFLMTQLLQFVLGYSRSTPVSGCCRSP